MYVTLLGIFLYYGSADFRAVDKYVQQVHEANAQERIIQEKKMRDWTKFSDEEMQLAYKNQDQSTDNYPYQK